MKKIKVVLVVPDEDCLESVVKNLNIDAIELVGVVTNIAARKTFPVGEKEIKVFPFSIITRVVEKRKKFVWLLGGSNDADSLLKLKKFLTTVGIPNKKIVNIEIFSQQSGTWLANVRHVEKYGADFFATGDECMRDGLNLKFIPCVHEDKNFSRGGANLSDAFQDLQQSYLTAKHVFAHVKRGTIKFVLIGLTPKSFLCDNSKDFINRSKKFQYLSLTDFAEEKLLKKLFGEKLKEIFVTTPEQTDLNFNGIKETLNANFSTKSIADWEDDALSAPAEIVEKNIQILKDYIDLCRENEAQPLGVIFPAAPAARKIYDEELLNNFREIIRQLEESNGFTCIDMFDFNLDYDCFSDMTHLNKQGMKTANAFIALNLYKKKLIPLESFCDMTHDYLYVLSDIAPKDDYNALMERLFETSAQLIRRKEKIKIAFVMYDSSMWCGDELYNFFANDPRFEPTIFLCLRSAGDLKSGQIKKDFLQGSKLLNAHGLNVVDMEDLSEAVEPQDVIIYLTPYYRRIARDLRPSGVLAKTLCTHIPYSFDIALRNIHYYNIPVFRTSCKIFFSSRIGLELYKSKSAIELPGGLFSGYPRTDIFFDKNADFQFEWKMAQPDAKKIIWAPHHSVTPQTVKYSTFRWNYQFMYEFAKAHPEISWVVKPHPNLSYRTIEGKIFSTIEEFEKYMQTWDELPNAQVYTGAYYQNIFATSDGMIHDSGSFIAEYQFVDKPMIFLTRDTQEFNELGNEILSASYTVDGKDLEAIAATMQKVFIEGNDDKAAARKEVFDKYLNYPKYNGMLASEFIYRSIADDLKALPT